MKLHDLPTNIFKITAANMFTQVRELTHKQSIILTETGHTKEYHTETIEPRTTTPELKN